MQAVQRSTHQITCPGSKSPSFLKRLVDVPDDPFYQPRTPLWLPREMKEAPHLDPKAPAGRIQPRYALLINPFYAKSPHGSFGKHVLTPTLALTSIAAATPRGWQVRYWDENLLQGPPPIDPVPEVVGISVHLTFAQRAYELAAWYRARGAKVVMGGLHTLSCPDEVAPHADAMAIGDGVQLWPQILRDVEMGKLWPLYRTNFERDYQLDPAPRRDLLPRDSFLTTTSLIATRGCHNRCGFCYLATEGLYMLIACETPRTSASNSQKMISRMPCLSTTISVPSPNICARCAEHCDHSTKSGARRSPWM